MKNNRKVHTGSTGCNVRSNPWPESHHEKRQVLVSKNHKKPFWEALVAWWKA